jgi:rhomboid protease GluP
VRPGAVLLGRLATALVAPGKETGGVLVAFQPPLAVVELPEQGAGVVLLDEAGVPADELRRRLDRILETHQSGLLFVVVVGGSASVVDVLTAADRSARDPNRLGMYHLDDTGVLARIAGRKLPTLDSVMRRLHEVKPFTAEDVPAIIARGQVDREEAAHFAAKLKGRFPWVTVSLVVSCVVLHALGSMWGGDEALLRMGANSGFLVRQGQVWRLLASAFLHGGMAHLAMNMLALYSFGSFLEAVLGWRRYLILYGVAALGGSVASALIANNPVSVGASGAVWGLMTAGFALARGKAGQSLLPSRIAASLRQRLWSVLLLSAAVSLIPGIDLACHAGGGVVGFLLIAYGGLVPTPGEDNRPDSRTLQLLAALTALALVGSVLIALAVGRPWLR